MFCLRCGTKVEDNQEFCPHCGANIKEELKNYNYPINNEPAKEPPTHEQQYNYSLNYSFKGQNNTTNKFNPKDEEYLKAFIGPKYDKIKNTTFSFPMFFLGPFYLFYRKMYMAGLIYILSTILLFILSPFFFIVAIILGFSFKFIYIRFAIKKVNKLLMQYKDLDHESKIEECKRAGGTNLFLPIIIFILTIISIVVIFITLLVYSLEKDEQERLKKDTTFKLEELSYTIPKGYQLYYDIDDDNYYTGSYSNLDGCFIDVGYTTYQDYITNETEYLEQKINVNLGTEVSPITTQEINGNVWTTITTKTDLDTTTTYVLKNKKKYYALTFKCDNENYNQCQIPYQKTLNSLKIQK